MPRRGTSRAVTEATELEHCVLGILGLLGPCTAYAVRQYLTVSQSSYWSGSAGAIYPLLKRLTAQGWAKIEETAFGSRHKRSYSLTASGRRQLRSWLSAPVPDAVAALTFDPVRTRVFFLELTRPKQRAAFVQDAIDRTAEVLERHRSDRERLRAELSEFDLMGREGAIRELQARLQWLQEVKVAVEKMV